MAPSSRGVVSNAPQDTSDTRNSRLIERHFELYASHLNRIITPAICKYGPCLLPSKTPLTTIPAIAALAQPISPDPSPYHWPRSRDILPAGRPATSPAGLLQLAASMLDQTTCCPSILRQRPRAYRMPLELPPHLTTSDSLRSEEVVMFYWAGESQGDTLVATDLKSED